MTKSMLIGIAAALLASLAWAMNFVVPYVIGDYSVFDFAQPSTLRRGQSSLTL